MEVGKALCIVTGGASGAGLATAQALARDGATVAIFDLDDAGDKVAKELEGFFFKLDVGDAQAVEQAFHELMNKCSLPLRVLVQCAGIAPPSRMTGKDGPKPLSFFEKVIQVNLVGTYNVMRLASFYMTQEHPLSHDERGVIINTASVAAFEGQIGQTAYAASKAGVVGMTLPAARELAQFGIRVMTIAPGLVDTPMLQGLPEETRTALESNTPFPKRFAKPEEFAQLALHVISNAMLNGEVIRLDGALRMQPK